MRTFIAIELPLLLRQQIEEAQNQLQTYLRQRQIADCLAWTLPQNVHLTLRFLGESDERPLGLITQGLRQLVCQQQAFALEPVGVGVFPNPRSLRILWLGLRGDLEHLAQLQAQIEHLARQAGFAPETRSFSPHLTLARAGRNAARSQLAQVGQALQALPAGALPSFAAFLVEQVVWMRSELLPGGARYTPLDHFEFAGSDKTY